MFSTYERPSAEPLNGRCPDAPTCELDAITRSWREDAKGLNTEPKRSDDETHADAQPHADYEPPRPGHYTREELALRTGVPHDALRDPKDAERSRHYAAIDVVRLAVVDRLARSGVPVAHAAALVRAAESRAAGRV
ncbi:MAG TPA: hypothetical protein VFU65_16900 [Actinocrinis sp.]|nr:hypothetical protein [Actinocrinis sp.]